MKSVYEENKKRIDELQDLITTLVPIANQLNNTIGKYQDELQNLQSENSVMIEEIKSGKSIETI